jgi:hypothetical protein
MHTLWFEVAVMASIFAVGNIVFGHFEAGTPKWRRVAKFFVMTGVAVAISAFAGRVWFWTFLAVLFAFVLVVHGLWLPKQGIHPLTGEPRERYYRMRGWKLPGE